MKISIITATYNSAETLRDTMESLLKQTYDNYEYIVVDGNSKDETMDLVREYEPRFEGRMRWISESDKGLYDAMNKGLKMAQGDVVGLLNSDDFYTSNDVLEQIVRTLSDEKADAVYGDVHYVNANNLQRCVRYYSSKDFRRSWMRLGFMPAHPSFYCRRDLYLKHGLFDTSYKVAADFEQLLRLIYVNNIRTCYLQKDFVTMRTGGVSNAGWRSHLNIMRDHRRALRTNGVRSCYPLLALRYFYKIYEIVKSRGVSLQ